MVLVSFEKYGTLYFNLNILIKYQFRLVFQFLKISRNQSYLITDNSTDNYEELWDSVLLDSARGSQIYSWAKREETTEDLSSISVKQYLRGTKDSFYNKRFVKMLADTTLEDVIRVINF